MLHKLVSWNPSREVILYKKERKKKTLLQHPNTPERPGIGNILPVMSPDPESLTESII